MGALHTRHFRKQSCTDLHVIQSRRAVARPGPTAGKDEPTRSRHNGSCCLDWLILYRSTFRMGKADIWWTCQYLNGLASLPPANAVTILENRAHGRVRVAIKRSRTGVNSEQLSERRARKQAQKQKENPEEISESSVQSR